MPWTTDQRAEACLIIGPERADVPQGAKAGSAATGFIVSTTISDVNVIII